MKINSGKVSYKEYTVRFAGASDTGKRRSHNEDSFTLLPESQLFCLADGVGGLDAGEVASNRAIEHIVNSIIHNKNRKIPFVTKVMNSISSRKPMPSFDLLQVISDANRAVYDLTQSLNKKMASTMVALQLHQDNAIIGSVGDSRVYLLRKNILGQVTIDHTLAMTFLLAGLPIDSKKLKINEHTITRAIGSSPTVEVEQHIVKLQPGDMFLLCSDGLTDMLSDKIICTVAKKHSNNLSNVIQELINGANDSGGRDNITVIAIVVDHKEE